MRLKNTISLFLLSCITFLVSYKYISRFTEFASFFSVLIILSFVLIWLFGKNIKFRKSYIVFTTFFLGFFIGVVAKVVFPELPVTALSVDRWSIISSFWEAALNGQNPYTLLSDSENLNGHMPFYFLLSLPFFLMGETGYMALLGISLFVYLYCIRINNRGFWLFVYLFLLVSPITMYEVATRSTMFFNAVLILSYLVIVNHTILNKKGSAIMVGLLGGLFLSIQHLFGITFLLFAIYAIRQNRAEIKNIALWGAAVIIGFVLTFLPIFILLPGTISSISLLVMQSIFTIPLSLIIIFLFISLLSSLLCRTENDTYFYSGLQLFVIISFYFIYHIQQKGYNDAYLKGYVDISYYMSCVPFLLYSIRKRKDIVLQPKPIEQVEVKAETKTAT